MNELLTLIQAVWRHHRALLAFGFGFGAVGIVVALLLPEIYRAQAVLSPVETTQSSGGSSLMAQLASIPGVSSLGISAGANGVEEHVAYLTSRSFAEEFIVENDLVSTLTEGEAFDSDEAALWQAYKTFDLEVRRVIRDPITGLVSLAMDWTDPHVAADWANRYIDKVNLDLRTQALERAERNIAFANEQLAKTTVVELQEAIYSLIEAEIRTAMLAQGQDDFAFRFVDRALPPGERYRPRRALVVIVFGLIGGIIGLLYIIAVELRALAVAERSRQPQA